MPSIKLFVYAIFSIIIFVPVNVILDKTVSLNYLFFRYNKKNHKGNYFLKKNKEQWLFCRKITFEINIFEITKVDFFIIILS